MGGRYAYVGDDPAGVSSAATILEQRASAMATVASSSGTDVPRLRDAWTVGTAGDRAYAVAARLTAHVDTVAPGLRAGTDALAEYREELVLGRSRVDQLNSAHQVIAPLESRVRSFGDWIKDSQIAAYDRAVTELRVAASATGYGSVADIDADYRAVKQRVTTACEVCQAALQRARSAVQGRQPGRSSFSGLLPVGLQTGPLIDSFISRGLLPPEAATMTADELLTYLKDHPDVARKLVDNNPGFGQPGSAEAFLHSLTRPTISAPNTDIAAVHREQTSAYFHALTPEEQAVIGMLFPSEVGNLSGASFVARDAANYVNVVVARQDQATVVTDLENKIAGLRAMGPYPGIPPSVIAAYETQLADARRLLTTYTTLVNEPDRQILVFDAKSGAYAELTGTIGPGTRNVGVICPGTTTNMGTILGNVAKYSTFVEAAPPDELAMITWMGGGLPQTIFPEALSDSYSRNLGPLLSSFSKDVRMETGALTAGSTAHLTVAGHSYGGAVVGIAETYGLDADRVMHVESAGMGNDVGSINDYRPVNPDVRRYSMTAPGDPIAHVQGADIGSLGHGADPDLMEGVTRLYTGNYEDGTPVEGTSAHGGVFNARSDSWKNMYEVFTGGTVQVRPPDTVTNTRYGPITAPSTAAPTPLDIP